MGRLSWPVFVSVVGVLILTSACRVDLLLDVVLEEDGSSLVEFTIGADGEVMAYVDVDDVDLSGIAGTGWELVGPVQGTDPTGSSVTLTKSVPSAGQLGDVVAQIDQGRLFRDVEFIIDNGLGVTSHELQMTIDPTVVAADFSDTELAELLDGQRFGELVEVLEERAGASLDESVHVAAHVVMPDGTEVAAGTDLAGEDPVVLAGSSRFVDDRLEIRAEAAADARSRFDASVRRVAKYWGAAAVLSLVLLSLGWRRRHRLHRSPAP